MLKIIESSQDEQNEPLETTIEYRAEDWLPRGLTEIGNHQTELPRIAKDAVLIKQIEHTLPQIPTRHDLYNADACRIDFIAPESVHLVLTSPPYWTLKTYRDHPDQLGDITDYAAFLDELNKVWRSCYRALVPGGRLVCVVGDVCLSVGKIAVNTQSYRCMPRFRNDADK